LCVVSPLQAQAEEAAPAPADTEPADALEKLDLQMGVYGFVKVDAMAADNAVLTFGRENLLAPVQAKRRVQFDDSETRSQIHANQSRVGLKVEAKDRVRGKLEFDFVGDYGASQPNTGVITRLRLAYLEYDVTPDFGIMAGQNWDIFSPLNPGTYNVTGVLYGAGNAGWIREQIALYYRPIPAFKLSMAVGNTTINGSASPALNHELNGAPTFAAQAEYTFSEAFKISLSGILANVKYSQPLIEASSRTGDPFLWDPEADAAVVLANLPDIWNGNYSVPFAFNLDGSKTRRRQSDGVALAISSRPSKNLKIMLEGYYGRNLGNIRTLTLGSVQVRSKLDKLREDIPGYLNSSTLGVNLSSSTDTVAQLLDSLNDYDSVWEAGGWLTIIYDLSPRWEGRLFGGLAQVLNREVLNGASAATLSKAQADRSAWGSAQLGAVFENQAGGYSLAFKPYTNLRLYFEHTHFRTFYYDPVAVRRFGALQSISAETGAITSKAPVDQVTSNELPANDARANVYRLGLMLSF
jgi:hypothetical protein